MADLTITAANIALGGVGVQTTEATASEAITQGQVVIQDATTRKWSKAINTSAANAAAGGIALTKAGADGDTFLVATVGPLIIGATLAVGQTYYLSDTAGGIMPAADLATGDWVTRLGVAMSATLLKIDIDVTGIQYA